MEEKKKEGKYDWMYKEINKKEAEAFDRLGRAIERGTSKRSKKWNQKK